MHLRAWWLWSAGLLACAPAPAPKVGSPPAPTCGPVETIEDPVRIPFGMYSVPVDRFEDLSAAGMTMVGPYYGGAVDAAVLDAAHDRGLRVLYPVGFDGVQVDDDARARLEAQVHAVVDHPAIGGWYVLPEETRPWVDAEVEYLAWVRSTVHAADPLHRPLLSYQPNHRRRDELAAVSGSLDIVTRGLYANFVGATHTRAWVREGARSIAEATAETQTPWAVLEMFAQPDAEDLGWVEAWARHDVYASLVVGARGLLVFSGWPRAGFDAYAAYLGAYLQVADELNGTESLATPLLRGRPSDAIELERVTGPARVTAGGQEVDSVAWVVVRDGGTAWAYVVNSAEVEVGVKLRARCPAQSVVGPTLEGDVLRLPALGVAVLRASSK